MWHKAICVSVNNSPVVILAASEGFLLWYFQEQGSLGRKRTRFFEVPKEVPFFGET